MAHSDTLIFLTNISWISALFFLCYFFFVLFFLPTFYKKVRGRTLRRTLFQRWVLILIEHLEVGSLLLLHETNRYYFFTLEKLVRRLKKIVKPLSVSVSEYTYCADLPAGDESKVVLYRGFWLGATSQESRKFVTFFTKFYR